MKECFQEYLRRTYADSTLTISKAELSDCAIIQGISRSLTVSRESGLSGFVEYPDPGTEVWKKRLDYSKNIFILKKNSLCIGYASIYHCNLLTEELFPNDPIAQYISITYKDSFYLDQIGILSTYQSKGYGLLMANFADTIIHHQSEMGVAATVKKEKPSASERILTVLDWQLDKSKDFNNGLSFNIYTKVYAHV
jgi:hypothetical protein